MKLAVFLMIALPVCLGYKPSLQQGTIFDHVYDFMKGKGESLLLYEVDIPEEAVLDFYELVDIFDSAVNYNETRPICETCLTFMRIVKTAAATFEWSEVRNLTVNGCKRLLFNQSDGYLKVDVLCPGIIDNQGPHVFEIAKPKYRKTARELCEYQNACLLPKPNKRSRRRLPNIIVPYLDDEIEVYVENVKRTSLGERKKDALKIVQFADIHIEPDYAEGSSTDCGLYVCCDERYGEGDAGYYGDYNCNLPQRTMELFLKKAADIQPEFIIYSGDTPPHTFWEETINSQLNCSAILTEAMSRVLGSYSIYPSIGNHEMYPTNLYSMEHLPDSTPLMNEEFVTMWQELANFTQDSIDNMLQGGYYSQVIIPGLRILTINSNYWYSYNFYNVIQQGETDLMFEFMRQAFQQARYDGDKVLFVGHHVPGDSDAILKYSRVFEDMLAEYSDLIILHVAGHTHRDHYKVFSNANGEPSTMTFVNPSVTSKTNVNPSMRVYYIDEATFELVDFEQYGFILEDLLGKSYNNVSEPQIELWYSAVAEYALPDMSAASWRDLTTRMESNDELFMKYYRNFRNRFHDISCDETCKRNEICRTLYYSYDDYIYCTEDDETDPGMPNSATKLEGLQHSFITMAAILMNTFILTWFF